MKTILITGPESSGKSTLAKRLGMQFDFLVLDEYARDYLEQHGPTYTQETILDIAKSHTQKYEQLIDRNSHELVLLDSYLLNLKIWSTEKYASCDPFILNKLDAFTPDLVLLCTPDIPWEADALRENPQDRDRLFEIYQKELDRYAWNYIRVDKTNRTNKIEQYIKEFISKA